MACNNCSSGSQQEGGVPKGCNNNGSCGTGGCNKLSVFDWLSNMSLPQDQEPFDIVEVRFKNGRKDFYKNPEKLTLSMGDIVATESSPGHDVGIISLAGELVKVQMKKKKVALDAELPKIYRKATQKDVDIWSEARNREEPVRMRARELAIALNLEMKISDVEFQGDGSKATFYYTANDRVDFRQLIKDFAREFSIRIEMKQVGFRQEAARLGGIGSCGRELCCSTWLTDFRSVNTSAARYQQLSLNPQKLAGQCGKLKCCLNYELDTYLDALKEFPDLDTRLYTEKGAANCQKVDIFKELMWFCYENNPAHWHVLTVEQVKEILAVNAKHQKVSALEDFAVEDDKPIENNFQNVVGQDALNRFDKPKKRPNKNKKRKTTADNNVENTATNAGANTNTRIVKPNKNKPKPNNNGNSNSNNKPNANSGENATPNKKRRPNNNNRQKPSNNKNAPKKD
jgi:cell fate regulator YaaT (PSP1 superfamily)